MNEATTSLSVCKYSTQSGLKVEPCAKPEPTVMEQTRITAVTQHLLSVFDKNLSAMLFSNLRILAQQGHSYKAFSLPIMCIQHIVNLIWKLPMISREVEHRSWCVTDQTRRQLQLWPLTRAGWSDQKLASQTFFNDSCGFTVRTYLGLLNQTWNTENW